MLKLINLTKRFNDITAVDSINLTVGDGEVFGFLGPNGAGKTTTVKIISTLIKPTSGKVFIDDVDVIKNPIEAKKLIAYIPDEPYVYPYLTAREFLSFIARIYKIEDYNRKISQLLDFFSLSDKSDVLVSSYSHGMKQKLLIASVVLRNPKIMLFDEPTVGLDPLSIKKFKDLIKELTSGGTIVFMCTHILDMAEKICDRVAIINKGKIISEGKVEEIISKSNKNLEEIFLELTR